MPLGCCCSSVSLLAWHDANADWLQTNLVKTQIGFRPTCFKQTQQFMSLLSYTHASRCTSPSEPDHA